MSSRGDGQIEAMLKRLIKIIVALALLLVLLAVGLLLFVNTGSYRSALETAVADRSGYQLIIAGDVNLDLFPQLGLTLNDVRLRNPATPQELASTSAISLRVDTGQLLRGQLLVRELLAEDFHINYLVDAEGNGIWDVESSGAGGSTGEVTGTAAATDDDGIVTLSFQRIRIDNASIDYQDLSGGTRYSINDLSFESHDTNVEGRPFSVDLNFQFLNNGMSDPVTMDMQSNVVADINSGNVSIDDISFAITPMLLSGQIIVNNLNGNLSYDGSFESNSFDMSGLMQSLGFSEPEAEFSGNMQASIDTAFDFRFSGDRDQLSLDSFSANLAGTEIEADANLRFATDFTPANISYGLIASTIDLTSFPTGDTPVTETEGEGEAGGEGEDGDSPGVTVAAAAPAIPTPLPTDMLNSFNLLGSVYIESIIAGESTLEDINLFTNIEDGVLDIEMQPANAYGGAIQGAMRVDGSGPGATFSSQLSLDQLNIVEFAPSISRLDLVTGQLNAEASYFSEGSTTEQFLGALNGSTTFNITENSVDISLLKQVFTAIAALSPTGEAIQQWPDVIQFGELGGSILLEGGVSGNQQVELRMDNFDVSGTGGLDLDAGSFDYDLTFIILGPPQPQTIPINELYHDVPWPVDCTAAFADEVSQFCRPDFSRVREIFARIGSNALQNRLREEITDQVPEELQDAARGLLRSILN